MAAKKYLSIIAGIITEIIATVVSVGAADDGKIVALDSTGKLDASVMPVGITADTQQVVASEALAAGDYVNIWDNAGSTRVRKADATVAGKEANGFVIAAVSNAATATVYFEGSNTQLSSLTGGRTYFLATTAGAVTLTAPSGSGNIVQEVGRSTSATVINFEPSKPVTLA